jgi:hypothetical protein
MIVCPTRRDVLMVEAGKIERIQKIIDTFGITRPHGIASTSRRSPTRRARSGSTSSRA